MMSQKHGKVYLPSVTFLKTRFDSDGGFATSLSSAILMQGMINDDSMLGN